MTDKEKLVAIIQTAVGGCTAYWAGLIADHLIANGVGFVTDKNVGGKWIPSSEKLPENSVSVIGYIPSAAPMPTVRECYTILDNFYFPALNGMYSAQAVTHWQEMPKGPKEEST